MREPRRHLGGQFSNSRAPQVEGSQAGQALELQESLVGEPAAGEVEHCQVLQRVCPKPQEDRKHVVGGGAAEPHRDQFVGNVAKVFTE